MKVSSTWLKGIPKGKVETEFRKELAASRYILRHLTKILEDKLEDDVDNMRKRTAYSDPNWSFKQADHLATQRTYQSVIKLLEGVCNNE